MAWYRPRRHASWKKKVHDEQMRYCSANTRHILTTESCPWGAVVENCQRLTLEMCVYCSSASCLWWLMPFFSYSQVFIVGLVATPHSADLTSRVTCPLLHTYKSCDETLEGSFSPSKSLYIKHTSYGVTSQNVILHLKLPLILRSDGAKFLCVISSAK